MTTENKSKTEINGLTYKYSDEYDFVHMTQFTIGFSNDYYWFLLWQRVQT